MWTSFIGFMASGKSSVAAALGRGTGQPVVDLDREVERRARLAVPEIFRREGVAGWRRREADTLLALARRREILLATGGGLVEAPEARLLLRRRGLVVWLDAPWEVLRARLEREGPQRRPLIAHLGWEGLERLSWRRRRLYAACADFRLRSDRDDVAGLARSVLLRSLVWRRRGHGGRA